MHTPINLGKCKDQFSLYCLELLSNTSADELTVREQLQGGGSTEGGLMLNHIILDFLRFGLILLVIIHLTQVLL